MALQQAGLATLRSGQAAGELGGRQVPQKFTKDTKTSSSLPSRASVQPPLAQIGLRLIGWRARANWRSVKQAVYTQFRLAVISMGQRCGSSELVL